MSELQPYKVPEYTQLLWNVCFFQRGKVTEPEGNFNQQAIAGVQLVQHGDLERFLAAFQAYRLILVINAFDRLHAYRFRAA